MTARLEHQARGLAQIAQGLSPPQQLVFLDEVCGADPALRAAIERELGSGFLAAEARAMPSRTADALEPTRTAAATRDVAAPNGAPPSPAPAERRPRRPATPPPEGRAPHRRRAVRPAHNGDHQAASLETLTLTAEERRVLFGEPDAPAFGPEEYVGPPRRVGKLALGIIAVAALLAVALLLRALWITQGALESIATAQRDSATALHAGLEDAALRLASQSAAVRRSQADARVAQQALTAQRELLLAIAPPPDPNAGSDALAGELLSRLATPDQTRDPIRGASLRSTLGLRLLALGDVDEAGRQLRAAANTLQDVDPVGRVLLADVRVGLARWRLATGDTAEAEHLLRSALSTDDIAPETRAAALAALAACEARRNDTAAAVARLREAVAATRRILPPESPLLADRLEALADLQAQRGETDAAISLLSEALAARRRSFGPSDPRVAATLDRLGRLQAQRGDLTSAARLQREALAVREERQPRSAPDVVAGMVALADTEQARGATRDAEALLNDALQRQHAAGALDTPEAAQTLASLGRVVYERGDLDGAEPLLRQAHAIYRVRGELGTDDGLQVSGLLARTLVAKRDLRGAADIIADALRRSRDGDAAVDAQRATLLEVRAIIETAEQDTAAALHTQTAAVALHATADGEHAPTTAAARQALALLELECGNNEECERLLRRAIADFAAARGDDAPETLRARCDLATCLRSMGRLDEAEPLLLATYATLVDQFGPEHPETCRAVESLAALYATRGDADQAAAWRARLPNGR